MLLVTHRDQWQLCPLLAFWMDASRSCGNLFLGSDNIPEDLRDPFYIDQYEQEHIKPPVIKLLLSSELYCRVCSLILKGDQVAALQGHQSVIQALSRKGIYVMESDDTPVTDPDLSHAPIKMVSFLRVCGRRGCPSPTGTASGAMGPCTAPRPVVLPAVVLHHVCARAARSARSLRHRWPEHECPAGWPGFASEPGGPELCLSSSACDFRERGKSRFLSTLFLVGSALWMRA